MHLCAPWPQRRGRRGMTIKVAIIGAGNCASALVQGIQYYSGGKEDDNGLMMPLIGSYRVSDIEIVAAFDVTEAKVGRSLADALNAPPNNAERFGSLHAVRPITVQRGPTMDGLGIYVRYKVRESEVKDFNVEQVLRESGAEIVLNYLPVGSAKATRYYARAALRAGCAFVNCMPEFIASSVDWHTEFMHAGLPLIGDDVKSQLGATIVHRALAACMRDRGVRLERTSQLNVGGNADFYNMLERDRLASKRISKTRAVTSSLEHQMSPDDVHIGPSDYVPWLADRKWAYIRLEGRGFAGIPLSVELKLEVQDSPNSAGVVVDAIRCARVALDRGEGGALVAPSAWLMKSPPVQRDDSIALRELEEWLRG